MTDRQFEELVAFGREQTGVEFKGPGARDDKHFFALIAKAMIGMANHRDGGYIFIGVSEKRDGALVKEGLSAKQLSTWVYDDVANSIDEYVDPSLNFDLDQAHSDGKNFVSIEVHEFGDIPVLCKKTYDDVLRKGACYVRPRRKPETTEIPSQIDMRDLLDLATEKGLRKLLSQASRAGLTTVSSSVPNDSDLFNRQKLEFLK